jgi:hypothetical protein
LIVDADCGTSIYSNDDLHPQVAAPTALIEVPDGGRRGIPDAALDDAGDRPDGDLLDAGLPSIIGGLSVSESFAGEIALHNRNGIPAGPQSLVPAAPLSPFPAGSGTSLLIVVPQNFDLASEANLFCLAQSGDVDVTLPSNPSGVGAAASFTAHCQPFLPDGGTPSKDSGVGDPPAQNLVGCFRS